MIARVRTWAFNAAFFGGSVPIVLMAPVMALFGTAALRWWVVFWTRYHRFCARWVQGVRVVVSGEIPTTPALYAGKHQAMFETFEMVALLDAPVIVLKKELADIPVWGWAARRYGMIVVDREGSSGALRQMMRDAEAAAASGRSVVIFPEGTRVVPGAMPELKPGFVGLYRALKMPLVPVAIDSGHVWPKHGPKRPGIIRFAFQPAIAPGLNRREVEPLVHAAINVLEVGAAHSNNLVRLE
ncbi:1-acyl-sn-glycerol-3-phosphate acyltransferase [Sphingomonas donggukensis]|uniref:1-acyl-sn-glycerol-3-phosphate acyltransferase n=1 Tax=Sphingomonas donggukensis TaxID=2949093 RepID=A0ABY4TS41_9SPHN|nr:lysophospholipid acyltransferase family protein [Sphingomonas donggukensis]URW75200.1 1-acyl-sn-glycerol-3-phosphate acyltransferase [Sphingomonas donggukensis]